MCIFSAEFNKLYLLIFQKIIAAYLIVLIFLGPSTCELNSGKFAYTYFQILVYSKPKRRVYSFIFFEVVKTIDVTAQGPAITTTIQKKNYQRIIYV